LGDHLTYYYKRQSVGSHPEAKTLKSRTKTIKKLIFSIEKANIFIEKLFFSIEKLNIFIEKAIISIEKANIFIKKPNISIEKLNIFIEKETKTIEIMTFSIEKSGKFRLSRPIVSRQQREFEAICRIFQHVR